MDSRSYIKAPSPRFEAGNAGKLLQRQCACGGAPGVSGACAECEEKQLQRKAAHSVNAPDSTEAPRMVHDVLNSTGQPLDADTKAFFENRFGHDFSRVRIHDDARA